MSLLTYKDARPWAKAIQAAVLTGVMPPWHADQAHGEFANDRRLSDADKNTIAAWVAAGALEGNPADVPSPPKYVDGRETPAVAMLKDAHVKVCVYGHLHGKSLSMGFQGMADGIRYYLASVDGIDFKPIPITIG